MAAYLDPSHFPGSPQEQADLGQALSSVIQEAGGDLLRFLGDTQRILADNHRRDSWEEAFQKLDVLFKCGADACLDGPMIGVSMAIRDSDPLAGCRDSKRSAIAKLEWMATLWNATFAPTGLWMGKTFEPVDRDVFSRMCGGHPDALACFDPMTARIGRNFFREVPDPGWITSLGLPVLTRAWNLKDRPESPQAPGLEGHLLPSNLDKERAIPYLKTGGLFLAQPGKSVVPSMAGKAVYQLNYRWPDLEPAFPMTRLVDELVQIGDGIYLGQLVMATHAFSLGHLHVPLLGEHGLDWEMGTAYRPSSLAPEEQERYGYQNNGFFLMIDTSLARDAYSDRAFPFLRPRKGEAGFEELGYNQATVPMVAPLPESPVLDWKNGWKEDGALRAKFTTFCLEPSPRGAQDGDVRELLQPGESILQMLQRIQKQITQATLFEDHVGHFEALNRLFRCGVAPRVQNGVFQGQGTPNLRFDAPEGRDWYGQEEPCRGFDYYHGATLNLHFGFADTFNAWLKSREDPQAVHPALLLDLLQRQDPNVLNVLWAVLGRFIFPWAGKSFERISGRKLSMFLDESDDLAHRYPQRVRELQTHPASWPHYALVRDNEAHHGGPGAYAGHLTSGSWDQGMSPEDKAFWEREAADRWVFGSNLQDKRILPMDKIFQGLDMNYHAPLKSIQTLVDGRPSPFVRQGYIFLGTSGRESILPMNHGPQTPKQVFQFHYRWPLIGGAAPIGMCLDELVEIAQGLYLGQLIYTTEPWRPFHSSTDPSTYAYQLFGYFLLMDDVWERHRQAIGLDVDV